MKYRDARLLKQGDKVVSKFTGAIYLVESVEIYGKERPIRINCNDQISFWHSEVEDNEKQDD